MPPLSDELLLRVLAQADQATRVSCGLVSARAHKLLQAPDAWRFAVVHVLTARALCFLKRVRPETLTLVASNTADLAWFVEGLVANGCHNHMHSLTVDLHSVCFPAQHAVMDHIAEFARLERLLILCRAPDSPSPACLAIPRGHSGLQNLRELTCVALGETDEERTLEVYFEGACLPSLESIHVHAATSDVLACVRRFPRLHTLVYIPIRDTLEDAQLEGMSFRVLKLGVACEDAARFCMRALASLEYAEQVKLVTSVPLAWNAFVNLRDLHIRVCGSPCSVELVYPVARHIEAVDITSFDNAVQTDRDVGIAGRVGHSSNADFRAWYTDRLRVGRGCKVIIRL